MKDHPEEKRGRRWLAALLLLNLLLTALERTLPVWPYRSGPVLLLAAAGLLPTAVVLPCRTSGGRMPCNAMG